MESSRGYLQLVVSVLRLRFESEVRGILVRRVVPKSELDGAAVDTRALAVRASKAINPGNTAEELALDSGRTLRGAVSLVQEDWVSRAAVVGHLQTID